MNEKITFTVNCPHCGYPVAVQTENHHSGGIAVFCRHCSHAISVNCDYLDGDLKIRNIW